MIQTSYPGVVRGGVVLLNNETPLTEGTPVLVTPMNGVRNSGAAIIAALDAAPKVPAEWVDELEHLIAEGRGASAPPAHFSDETSEPENG